MPLPDKKEFYSNLTLEDIRDADYKHVKRVWEDFKIQNLEEYHDICIKSDTLLLADVFKSFHKKCIKMYELDSADILTEQH